MQQQLVGLEEEAVRVASWVGCHYSQRTAEFGCSHLAMCNNCGWRCVGTLPSLQPALNTLLKVHAPEDGHCYFQSSTVCL